MSLLARVEVTPYYGQVELSDPNKQDYPQFETGAEKVVAIPQCIAVVTRGDQEGKVTVEVWNDRLEVEGVDLQPVHEGDVVLSEDRAVVGNTVGNEFHDVPLSRGSHHVRVFTSAGGPAADTVYFLVEG